MDRTTFLLNCAVITLCLISAGSLGIDQWQERYNQPIGEIYGNLTVGQSFVATDDKLTKVDVKFATYARENTDDIFFQLREVNSLVNIVTITINAEHINDNSYHSFKFDPIPGSEGKTYVFTISSPNSTHGNAITILYTADDAYTKGTALVKDNPVNGDLSFRTFNEYSKLGLFLNFFQKFTRDLVFFLFYIVLLAGVISGIIWLHIRER